MIIIIAPEKDIPNEIEILTQLFQEGLQYYHFRKPNKNYQEHCDYLNQIDEKYHDRIVVHYFHELMNEFNLKGIHFQEQKRRDCLDTPSDYFTKFNNMFGKTISSSFHETEEIEKCNFEFDYHLLSPVFSSISKKLCIIRLIYSWEKKILSKMFTCITCLPVLFNVKLHVAEH